MKIKENFSSNNKVKEKWKKKLNDNGDADKASRTQGETKNISLNNIRKSRRRLA